VTNFGLRNYADILGAADPAVAAGALDAALEDLAARQRSASPAAAIAAAASVAAASGSPAASADGAAAAAEGGAAEALPTANIVMAGPAADPATPRAPPPASVPLLVTPTIGPQSPLVCSPMSLPPLLLPPPLSPASMPLLDGWHGAAAGEYGSTFGGGFAAGWGDSASLLLDETSSYLVRGIAHPHSAQTCTVAWHADDRGAFLMSSVKGICKSPTNQVFVPIGKLTILANMCR